MSQGFLLDTNVISELRKGSRAEPTVLAWLLPVPDQELYLSVLVVGELRRGAENLRRRDPQAALAIERWLHRIEADYAARILPITLPIVEVWARLSVPDPMPVIDSLLAATAQVHDLIVVTRNVRDIARTGVPVVNPFLSG